MQGFKWVNSCRHRLMSAAHLEQVVGGLLEQVSFRPLHDKDAAQARGSPLHMCTPCSRPCIGWDNSSELPGRDIARQGSDARYNDKSMFAEVRSTISSEWIEHSGAEVKPCGISLLSIHRAHTCPKEIGDCVVHGACIRFLQICVARAVASTRVPHAWVVKEEIRWRKCVAHLQFQSMPLCRIET